MSDVRRWRWRGLFCGLLGLLAWGMGSTSADEIDDAAARPREDAVAALERVLEAARAAGDEERAARAQEALARTHRGAGALREALPYLEALVDSRGRAEDRVAYGEVLLAIARENIATQGMGRRVEPFLRDALDALASLGLEPDGVQPPTLRLRLVAVVVECRYLLRDYPKALAALEAAAIAEGADAPVGLVDLAARCLYALERWEPAAERFARAGNPLGAAAAWDAARRPEKSVPLYAAAIAERPADGALQARALAGARFTGAQGALLEALAAVPVPDGTAGCALLLTRAALLEETGAGRDAVGLLREAARRDAGDPRPLVRLARLLLVTGDAESEAVWDEAAAAYRQALERDPSDDAAIEGLTFIAGREYGRLWRVWRDPRIVARCVGVQEAMVAALPDDALALANLGNTLRVLGRHAESLRLYERAREANPYDPAVESDYGLALSASGQAQAALEAYERSVALDPGHLAGRQNAARALWLRGEDDAAEAHLGAGVRTARAVSRSPGVYRFLLDRIWRCGRDPSLR